MYRLNINLPDEMADKLAAFCQKHSITRTNLVTNALQNYMQTMEVQAAIIDRLKSDPAYVAKLAKLMEAEGEGQA